MVERALPLEEDIKRGVESSKGGGWLHMPYTVSYSTTITYHGAATGSSSSSSSSSMPEEFVRTLGTQRNDNT